MHSLPVAGPWITQKEIDYVTDAVTSCWYDQAGKYHEKFERAFAQYVGCQYAVSLPSCTSAIHLSLAALGVGPGDEVIVPDVTWIASAAPIQYVGAQPILADIDPTTWCLSATSLETLITPQTRAVIVVDLYGGMPDMDALREVSDRHRLPIVEDAAEGFGSRYRGRLAGSFGTTGVFSFHGSKTMTTGEGGMLVTDQEDLYQRVLFLRDHGRVPGDVHFTNREVAYKYKMSSMQAALGLAQVERANELVGRKRLIASWYREDLAELPGVTLNSEPEDTENSFWMDTVVLDPALGIEKRELARLLKLRGIDTRPFFHPLSSIPAFRDTAAGRKARERNTVSYRISPYGVNLPSSMRLTREQIAFISNALREIVLDARSRSGGVDAA